jgi:hypothetical protein
MRGGGRVLRFLGLPQAASRLDDQHIPGTPCAFLEARTPSEVFLDLPEEPPSTQAQPRSDLEISQNRRKRRPDEAQENHEFRF